MSDSKPIVVDTNVWLDYLLGFRSLHDESLGFVLEATRQELPLVIPSHSLKDVFFVFQQQLKQANRESGRLETEAATSCARTAAWEALDTIMGLATVGPSDHSDAWVASKHRAVHGDYEDNLVIATALRVDARFVVTNDASLIKHSPVATVTAHDARALIAMD